MSCQRACRCESEMRIFAAARMRAALALFFVSGVLGCSYHATAIGSQRDYSETELRTYVLSEYGALPAPVWEEKGRGALVQWDRMITLDLVFTDASGRELSKGRIRFVHSATADVIPGRRYLFGYASPALLGAIALMRAGGHRIVGMTDT